MKKGLKLSVVAAATASLFMVGCSNSSYADAAFSIKIADGYAIKTGDSVTMTCGTTVHTANDAIGASGVVTFPTITAPTADCVINAPANTILDSDSDGLYDAANDFAVGFSLRASGDDSVVSQFTGQVLDLKAAGKATEAAALKLLVKDFDPVAAISTAATNVQVANLLTVGEAIKFMKKNGATAVQMADINASDITSGSPIDVTAFTANIHSDYKTATRAQTNVIAALIADLTAIVAANPTVDVTKLFVAISDGGATATEALTAATTETIVTTGTAIANIDTKIATADTAAASIPAYLTLGATMNLGDLTVGLSNTGTFAAEVDVNTASTLTDFSKITLPSATLNKGFSTQSFYLMTTITNKADSGDTVVAMLGSMGNPVQLDASDDNQSVKVTIPSGTPMDVNTTINGSSSAYTSNTSIEQVNTDLSFDVCGVIDCENSAISALNNHLTEAGKSYDVNITLVPTDSTNFDANLTLDYFSVTGVITTK